MTEIVVFTSSPIDEVLEIETRTQTSTGRKIFVYGKTCDVSYQKARLPDWTFVVFEESMANAWIQYENQATDTFVLHHCHPAKIPDRNLGMYQLRCVGQKLVFEEHPFLGKGEPWYLYFPYSFVDKRLLGYPHSYAFRDSRAADPYNPVDLARKVAPASVTYLKTVYPEPLQTVVRPLTGPEHAAYASLKAKLFEEETTPKAIISGLKKFVDSTDTLRQSPTTEISVLRNQDLWDDYKAGKRLRVLSDAKVDQYLRDQQDDLMDRANRFMAELYCLSGKSRATGQQAIFP